MGGNSSKCKEENKHLQQKYDECQAMERIHSSTIDHLKLDSNVKKENSRLRSILTQLKLLAKSDKNKQMIYDIINKHSDINLGLNGGSNNYYHGFKEDIVYKKYLNYKQKYINLKNKRNENL